MPLMMTAELKAEAIYLEQCKTTSEAFHFLHVEGSARGFGRLYSRMGQAWQHPKSNTWLKTKMFMSAWECCDECAGDATEDNDGINICKKLKEVKLCR